LDKEVHLMKWWVRLHNYRMEYKLILFGREKRLTSYYMNKDTSYYREYPYYINGKGVGEWRYPKLKT
jgi:hypothetical protein